MQDRLPLSRRRLLQRTAGPYNGSIATDLASFYARFFLKADLVLAAQTRRRQQRCLISSPQGGDDCALASPRPKSLTGENNFGLTIL
jgi:hypothetical protein